MSNIDCRAHNGSYTCRLVLGHSGEHTMDYKSSTGETRVATWKSAYSKVEYSPVTPNHNEAIRRITTAPGSIFNL